MHLSSLCLLGVTLAAGGPDPRPLSEQPFTGLGLRQTPEGPVIGWVRPGPFTEIGEDRPRRSDLVVSVNDQPITADSFAEILRGTRIGDPVTLKVKRGPKSDPHAAVPIGDPAGELLTFTTMLQSRDEWTGTLGRGETSTRVPAPTLGEFESRIIALAKAHELWTADDQGKKLEDLNASLATVQAEAADIFVLPIIRDAIARPLSLDAADARLLPLVRAAAAKPDAAAIRDLVTAVLGPLDTAPPVNDWDCTGPWTTEWGPSDDDVRHVFSLVRALRDSVSLDGPGAKAQIASVRAAPAHWKFLTDMSSASLRWLATAPILADQVRLAAAATRPPPGFESAATGEIRGWWGGGMRLAVIGGPGPNRYDMSRIDTVYDVGGDDTYIFTSPYGDPTTGHNCQIVDVAGNDTYESSEDFCGPGVGVFGVSLVDDLAGNDTYRTLGQCSLASGLFGVGIIIDRAGDDRYENTGLRAGWSIGSGFYGAGLIIDQTGSDTYIGEKLCQGVGGPRGFGVIIDGTGQDRYRADGPTFTSAYGTPGVFLSMSQGFGMGIRGYASGGVGAIYDLEGSDRYEAGEFSQACGYFFALGLIHDAAGSDSYHGNRYSQAAAAHQAAGLLIDDSGDDTYWSMTAASQSGAWDESISMLIDRAGDDAYRCDGLGQGAAAQQAIAMLIDLGGSDRFQAAVGVGAGAGAQGCSGTNEYHFSQGGLRSFSLLLDAGPGVDWFSTGRRGTLPTGAPAGQPEASSLFGLFADEPP